MKIKSFNQANQYLAKLAPGVTFSAKESYTLGRMRALMDCLGNPQNDLKVIHVAGTSGKTSTSYYAASLLKKAGLKVGLTVSPHITEINERVQIDLVPLPEELFCREFSEFLELIERSKVSPTYFELIVAFAYWEFAKQQVDYAVVEVGLGGLLDGTNVITSSNKVCVITDIGLDHINVLGNSLSEIAYQKAGIIQDGNVVFAHEQKPEANRVFSEVSNKHRAKLQLIEPRPLPNEFGSLPLFQQRNFSLAEAAIKYILQRDGIQPLTKERSWSASQVHIPGRMEIFEYGGKIIILDGAHNSQKIQTLVYSLSARFPQKKVSMLVGFSAHKDSLELGIRALVSVASRVIVTSFRTGQDLTHHSAPPDKVAKLFKSEGFGEIMAVPDSKKALHDLLECPEKVLLITGSLYLIYKVRPLLLELLND